MDVNKLLDELEELVEKKSKFFHRIMFLDADDVVEYTHMIRVSLPQQIQRADQITRDKERILAEAQDQATRMVTEAAEQAELTIRKAQDDARAMVSNHEITRQAQTEGQRLVEQARLEGEAIRQGALEYAKSVLDNLNGSIDNLVQHTTQIQQVAQRARDEIKV
jgi:vacuolar-type H+-ATPase subunit H